MTKYIFFLLICLCGAPTLTAQETEYETLRHIDGCVMRATPIIIGKMDYAAPNVNLALNPAAYPALKGLGLNAIRLCWVDPWRLYNNNTDIWTVEEVAMRMDSVINMATRNEMMTIINYHATAEYQMTSGFGVMAPFWEGVAARYKDNPYVIYEMANEQAWNADTYLSDAFKLPYKAIYEQIRRDAPERQVIIGSFHSANLNMKRVVDGWSAEGWIDWDYTTVGWHFYGWGENPQPITVEERKLLDLIENYPSVCTEWGYPEPDASTYIKPFFGQEVMSANLENFQISWVDWRDWNDATLDEYQEYLLPDAEAQGYEWDLESCKTVSVSNFGDPALLKLFPNPTTDFLRLEADVLAGPESRIRVYSIDGREIAGVRVVRSSAETYDIDVDKLKPGAYLLRVTGAHNFVKQFVKY